MEMRWLQTAVTWVLPLVFILPSAPFAASQEAGEIAAAPNPPHRAEWGLLADIVEQAFQMPGYLVTARWLEPAKALEIVAWNRLGIGTLREVYQRDPITGEIFQGSLRFSVAPDGSVQRTSGKLKLLWRDADGGLRLFASGAKIRPLRPGSWQEAKLAVLVAKGEMAAAQAPVPNRSATSASPAPRVSGAVVETASPAGPITPEQRAMLASYVGKSFAEYQGTATFGVVRTRWLVPEKRFEWRGDYPFRKPVSFEYEVNDDGTLTVSGAEAAGATGVVGADGLPHIFFTANGKQFQTRLVPVPGGFQVVQSENTARAGKAAKWKVRTQTTRREITGAQADRLIASGEEQRRLRWSPVAGLIDGPWFCVQHEPVQWLTRQLPIHQLFGRPTNRSLPVMRLTSARWITPWQEMEIVSTLGTGRKVVDRITMLADGTFIMTTTGHDGVATLRGTYRREQYSGELIFPVANVRWQSSDFPTGISFTQNYDFNGAPAGYETKFFGWGYNAPYEGCAVQKYDENKSITYEQELTTSARGVQETMQADQEYWADAAQSHAEGQQMLANMRGQLFQQVFVGIPQAVADVSQRRAQLESLRVAAQQETAMKQAAMDAARRTAVSVNPALPSSPTSQGGSFATGAPQALPGQQVRATTTSIGNGGAIIVDSRAAQNDNAAPSTVARAAPAAPASGSPPVADTCKRRVPYNYGAYAHLPYQEGTRCLDNSKVRGQ